MCLLTLLPPDSAMITRERFSLLTSISIIRVSRFTTITPSPVQTFTPHHRAIILIITTIIISVGEINIPSASLGEVYKTQVAVPTFKF